EHPCRGGSPVALFELVVRPGRAAKSATGAAFDAVLANLRTRAGYVASPDYTGIECRPSCTRFRLRIWRPYVDKTEWLLSAVVSAAARREAGEPSRSSSPHRWR